VVREGGSGRSRATRDVLIGIIKRPALLCGGSGFFWLIENRQKTYNMERSTKQDIEKEKRDDISVYLGVGAEALFALFPLIVIGVVLWYDGRLWSILETPEWSFAAAVLSGQTLVKLMSGTATLDERTDHQFISLLGAGIFVLLLGPSIVTLTFIILSDYTPLIVSIAQITILIFSLLAFLTIGGLGQQWTDTGKI